MVLTMEPVYKKHTHTKKQQKNPKQNHVPLNSVSSIKITQIYEVLYKSAWVLA